MQILLSVLVLIALGCHSSATRSEDDLLNRASALEVAGRFRECADLLRGALPAGDTARTKEILFEIDRLRRIRLDYSLTKQKLWSQLKSEISGITPVEYESWISRGWFDNRIIDDTLYFVGVSRSNLFWRHPELVSRRVLPKDESEGEHRLLALADSIMQRAAATGSPIVLPKRFRMTASLRVDADAVPDGATVRAWIPVPREFPYQTGFRIISTSGPVRHLAPGDSPIRAVMMEQAARRGEPTLFTIDYEYTASGVWHAMDPSRVEAISPGDALLDPYLREESHVRFTEKISRLSREIVGEEKNPLRIAKRIHDWISENILYSYAIEYSTIRNISDYCLTKGYGDCGQHALLFITLCRYNGVPARWQSGWYTFPGSKTIHDWTEIYIAPYGWVPVDPDMGIFAMRYFTSLKPEERKRLRDFFFGGLEQYRMGANAGHSLPLSPAKRHHRSDTVDFQRGEVEWDGGNLYFDLWDYTLRVRELPG